MSNVIAAEACPSIFWTALTLAPALTARLAAVCRRSCGVVRGFLGMDDGFSEPTRRRMWPLEVVAAVTRPQQGLVALPPRTGGRDAGAGTQVSARCAACEP